MDSLRYKNALLLEDEPIITLDVEDILGELGFRGVTHFDTCQEALTWLADNRPDVAIIDVRLKDGECDEVARILEAKGVPTVVHSAFVDAEASSFDFAQFVSKPAVPEAFSDAIHALAKATPTEQSTLLANKEP
jgi:DNA-binding NarL/FixJ family response regulator